MRVLLPPSSGFGGVLTIIESVHLTETLPHPMSSERHLAKIAGGKWSPKTATLPSPKGVLMGDVLYVHPAFAADLRRKLKAQS